MSAAPLALDEVKAHLRLQTGDEDALLSAYLRTATALAEAFTGQLLIRRPVSEQVPRGSCGWAALTHRPVSAISGVALPDGTAVAADTDIDLNGDGWVRLHEPQPTDPSVSLIAGMADDWNGVPEPIRQGVTRFVAHLFTMRDAPVDAGPPAAVAALWRPWRRLRIGGAPWRS